MVQVELTANAATAAIAPAFKRLVYGIDIPPTLHFGAQCFSAPFDLGWHVKDLPSANVPVEATILTALFLGGAGKLIGWELSRLRAGTKGAVSPLTIDMAAAKIEICNLDEKLNASRIEVARTSVIGDVITRLERRTDDMVTSRA